MKNKLALALAAALFALPTFAFAQDAAAEAPMEEKAMEDEKSMEASSEEESSNFSWNAAIVSDYVFRGVSQNDFKPAVQGGVDYAFGDTGFAVGTWASTVDFADGSDAEVDLYVGYTFDPSDSVSLNAKLLRYVYLGTPSGTSIDYNEFLGAVTVKDMITFTVGYANKYSNIDSEKQLYTGLSGKWEVADGVNVNAGFARTNFDTLTDYNDWNVGISKQFKYINLGLNYYDTNLPNKASDQVVLSISIGG
jgi:uncharacterized protein (TIGR02001 family)